ncbi:hypothetical protein JA1_005184 [Spathaspora sp. JA1]|nr:hypothetical protein JA1_005184 [Spathaspora sp. JA1]
MNKENVGIVANALKQLNVDKPHKSTLDEHLDLIHTTQEEIQTQLHNIEVQSTQTSVDLAQLFDRSKNNNLNLNRLLENVVSYSKEVMTEGNATKADMNRIFEKLETLETSGSEMSKVEFERVRKELLEFLSGKYNEGNNDVKEIKESQSELKEMFKSQASDVGDSLSSLKNISEDLTTETKKTQTKLDDLSEKIPDKNQIIDPIIQEVKSSETKLDASLQIITEKLTLQPKPESYQEQLELIITKISQLEQARKEEDDTRNLELINKQSELESKINQLETKYSTLCNSYTQKFQEYQTLNEKYTNLVHQIETVDVPTDMSRLKKVRQFHSTNQNTNFITKQKRITSTPVPKSAETEFINNSDEGF